jgi:hypothetical protein
MAEPKTQRTTASVPDFLAGVADPSRRADAQAMCALMTEETGDQPAMWGTAIVGFGEYTYHYGSGRPGSWPPVGFSPRKQSLTVYISAGFDGYGHLLERLGRHTIGKGCLYVPRLSEVDDETLRELVRSGFAALNGKTITPGVGPS